MKARERKWEVFGAADAWYDHSSTSRELCLGMASHAGIALCVSLHSHKSHLEWLPKYKACITRSEGGVGEQKTTSQIA